MLKILRSEGVDPGSAAFFMPAASGPCRFGLYNCLHRLVLKYAGVAGVPVIAPDQDTNFHKAFMDTIDSSSPIAFLKSLWIAIVGADLLHKLIMRLRPFAADPRHAQRVYQTLFNQWLEAVEKRSSYAELRRLMGTIADYFATIELNHTVQKPRIGIVGEIYVRSHPFANMNIVARLEQLGAACDLAPLAEWVYYVNFTRKNMARRKRQWRSLFTNLTLDHIQHKIEQELAAPLEEKFGRLAERPAEHVIELAAPYMHHSFEGEAILTVGKAVEYYHDGFGGVVNAMPFTCMPSTVVSSLSLRVSADCSGMPILNLSFDGQDDPTLTTRLEAFVEQVRQLQFGNATFAQATAAN
jgi:predicted nucleotide-binding protein (sugar kinase/HSP70/actin superfamily)